VSSADVLLSIATAARLFHAGDGISFADLMIDGHRETWPLRSKRFQAWLRQQYYERTWDAPSPAALNAALNALEAQAQFDGPQRKVSLRLAEQDGLIYLDLTDEFWRCVEIGANGWRIAEDPPVRFRRSAGMQPLPLPLRGGSIEALAPFLNLASENDFVLVVAWLLAALRAGGPYPVLAIAGEQGSAKTVLSKLLRAVIDPGVAPVRALPRDERELFIAASNNHVLAFDNLSGLPPWLSDTLCRLTSGGAFSTRQLFTDQDEILFAAARPVILNGIEDVITRPDLADRAILLMLAPIAEWQRRKMRFGGSSSSHARISLARFWMRPRMGYACCRGCASSGCRAWPTSPSGLQPARAHFDPRAPSKPLIPTTGATRSRISSTPIPWRPLCASSWPTERNGGEARPTFCRSAPTDLAGQRPRARWPAGCAGHRPSSAPLGLKLPSAARGGWERGQSV
jgi:hypothetical protein